MELVCLLSMVLRRKGSRVHTDECGGGVHVSIIEFLLGQKQADRIVMVG